MHFQAFDYACLTLEKIYYAYKNKSISLKKREGESMFFSLPDKIGESIVNYFFTWSIMHMIF